MILSYEAQFTHAKYSNIKDTELLDHLVRRLKTYHSPYRQFGDIYVDGSKQEEQIQGHAKYFKAKSAMILDTTGFIAMATETFPNTLSSNILEM